VLGLGLARAGAAVTVLEKHADFLRDFRGDTVHASTLELLDELGLGEQFAALPQRWMERAQVQLDQGTATVADLTRLPGPHRHIALVPQWDLLELLARAGQQEPAFDLRRRAEVDSLVVERGTVRGVRYVDRTDGSRHELRADLVVACDGRDSAVRRAAGLRPRSFGAPMDVEWFRLPRTDGDPAGLVARVSTGRMVVLVDRGDYWQCAYIVPKGGDAALRAQPVQVLRERLGAVLPWLGGRTDALTGWDDVRLLVVTLNRLRRWSRDGLLLIGDAAHAMSPVGGVGINLAVQDAVAATRILGDAVRTGRPLDVATLRRVQRRRWWPTALVQTAQRIGHRAVIARALRVDAGPAAGQLTAPAGEGRLPLPVRVLQRTPALQGLAARMVAIGPLPEHAPEWARRTR